MNAYNKTTEEINNGEHISILTGSTYNIGCIMNPDCKLSYDITVILDFNGEDVKLVNWYFGVYDYSTTEQYIGLAENTKEDKLVSVLLDALNVLNARQVLEGPMPTEWNKYCSIAQHIDPDGDWTNVEYNGDSLEALISFVTNQLAALLPEPIVVENACTIEEIIAADPDEDFDKFDDVFIDISVMTTGATGYTLQNFEVLAQNLLGCTAPSIPVHTPVVAMSNAELTLVQIAMDYAIEHPEIVFVDVCEDDATGYAEALSEVAEHINKANSVDDFDIQVRN